VIATPRNQRRVVIRRACGGRPGRQGAARAIDALDGAGEPSARDAEAATTTTTTTTVPGPTRARRPSRTTQRSAPRSGRIARTVLPPARRTGRLTTHNKLEACDAATRDLADRTVPGDRADRVRRSIRRPDSETKAASKTTGLYAFLVVLVGILNCREQHRGRGRRSRLLRRRQGVAVRHAADCRLHGQPRSGQGQEPRPLLVGARRPRHRPRVTHGPSPRGRAPDGNESPPGPRPTLRTGQRAGRKHRLATSGRCHFLAWP
jgi:hypothetical protein